MSPDQEKEAIPEGTNSGLFALVERIKRSPNYTTEIGLKLGIELPDESVGSISWKGKNGKWRYAFFATGRVKNLYVSSRRKSLTCPEILGPNDLRS